MTVPKFGKAELVSFSCGVCLYRHNKFTMIEPPRDYGVVLKLVVRGGTELDGTVILSDNAMVRCKDLELEMTGGGKYSNVEGVLRGCVGALTNAGIFSDVEGGDDIKRFSERVDSLIEGCRNATTGVTFVIEIEDPLGLSYMEGAEEVQWERTREQDEELGLGSSKIIKNDVGYEMETEKVVVGAKTLSRNDDDVPKLLRHCEAIAAEYTKEYREYDYDEYEISESKNNAEDVVLEDDVTGYGDCD